MRSGAMSRLHVMLDTSILRDDPPRRKAAFVRFDQLARDGHVTLHLPWLVQEEFISGIVDMYRKGLRDAGASLQRVPGLVLDRLGTDLKQRVNALRTEVESIIREDFQHWITSIGAEIHHATAEHTAGMLQRYFAGAPPFRQAKERGDIPDALIWECARAVAETQGTLHFVSGDSGFEGASQTSAIWYHTSLAAFVEFADHVLLAAPRAADERIVAALADHEDVLRRAVAEQLPNLLLGTSVTTTELENDEHEAAVTLIGSVGSILFDRDHLAMYGIEVMTVPFTASVETLLRYRMPLGRYVALAEERAAAIRIAERFEHHVDAEEDAVLDLDGHVGILVELPENDDDRDLRQALLEAVMAVEDVRIIRVRLASLE
jgi:hypothetical protein